MVIPYVILAVVLVFAEIIRTRYQAVYHTLSLGPPSGSTRFIWWLDRSENCVRLGYLSVFSTLF